MPIYDLVCQNDHEQIDVLLKIGERPPCPTCGAPTSTLWRSSPGVIGDECDVWIRHGLCHDDGSPRRFRSKSEIQQEAKKRGLTNQVSHVTAPGTDKAPHTTRWI